MIPVASRTSIGILLAVRALMGLCQSAVFPAIFHLFPRWIPASERTRMVVLVCSGIYLVRMLDY
jgi:predicted MFS family arabinose efflux permease